MLLRFVNPLRAGHEIPKYTKSRTTRSPEGHEVDCVVEFESCSLETMTNVAQQVVAGLTDSRSLRRAFLFYRTRPRTSAPAPGCGAREACGSYQSASDPQAPNSCEINESRGIAESTPFFVKLSRFAGVSEAQAEREHAGEIPSGAERGHRMTRIE